MKHGLAYIIGRFCADDSGNVAQAVILLAGAFVMIVTMLGTPGGSMDQVARAHRGCAGQVSAKYFGKTACDLNRLGAVTFLSSR